ncbi:phosphoethanolamine N-methyltransferase [Thraustotheca clavata]|uniref:phosphoethanolamine N-methyltransferase n=1 Tax=Thraustotheca clavata TaxID=74557 RepID=A0A1V9ZXR5_9STRA|nr:phosphoethanolamine N-methyltransferase [Thraustotheca clavata]
MPGIEEVSVATRNDMKKYWKEHSQDTTIETMMLDSNAKLLHELEIPEILNKLPPVDNKDVLELAAGIGRYTGLIAKSAAHVTAVEFIEDFHKANEKINGSRGNCSFICADVCDLERQPSSYDVIFSNWLLMYLSDEEVPRLALKTLKWLRPGGEIFFRESCFRQSGDVKRTTNPTKYRHPSFYMGAFSSAVVDEGNGRISQFELVSSSSVGVYRRVKKNNGQICFRFKKVTKEGSIDSMQSFQRFLDSQQYSNKSITRYEKIFGEGYVSTGGQDTTTEFVAKLNLAKGERVLDVGCGIGGGDFYMAKTFGVSVVGIDLSTNMVHRALETSLKDPSIDCEFEICDATTVEYPDESFDVVYSRDTILHIADKKALFAKFYRWLKPGGRLLISDYCCGQHDKQTDRFKAYVSSRGYHLLTPAEYGNVIASVGFTHVEAQDRTEHFVQVLKTELDRTMLNKDTFIAETSAKDFQDIVDGWESKLVRCADGDQKWGLFFARKE